MSETGFAGSDQGGRIPPPEAFFIKELFMKTAYFDLVSGASGDMILAAFIDCGVPVEYLQTEMSRLGIPGLSINAEKTTRGGISASHMVLAWDTQTEYRHLHRIMDIIQKGKYTARVIERCERVLTRLAQAEAALGEAVAPQGE